MSSNEAFVANDVIYVNV